MRPPLRSRTDLRATSKEGPRRTRERGPHSRIVELAPSTMDLHMCWRSFTILGALLTEK